MEEELFDSMEKSDRSLWMLALSDWRGHHDRATSAADPCPQCLPDRTSLFSLQGLWTQLLVRLSCAAWQCAKPDASQRLTAFGCPRARTVVSSLERERAKAQRIATAAGFEPHPEEVLRLTRELSGGDNLYNEFHGLAENYRLLLLAMHPPCGTLLYRWMLGRARVHFAQAEAIRRETLA